MNPAFRYRKSNKQKLSVCLILFILALLFVQPVSGLVILEYFHQPGCINCEKTDPVIESIRTRYSDRVTVESVRIDDRSGVRLLISYGVTEIPVVVINRNKVLMFPELTPERLDTEIRLAESGAYPVPAERRSITDRDNVLPVLFSFILGLMTGLSPCLLGSFVVLAAATRAPAANGTTGKQYPLVFGAGIVTAYLIMAAGILGAGIVFSPDTSSRPFVYGIAGIIAIAVGLVQLGLFSLPRRIDPLASVLLSRFHNLPGFFLLGILFAILFAPCAIAPFLILIETILLGHAIAPVGMLLAFAAGLLTPFGIITIIRNSLREEQLLRYTGIVQKTGGFLLVVFGIWLLLSA